MTFYSKITTITTDISKKHHGNTQTHTHTTITVEKENLPKWIKTLSLNKLFCTKYHVKIIGTYSV